MEGRLDRRHRSAIDGRGRRRQGGLRQVDLSDEVALDPLSGLRVAANQIFGARFLPGRQIGRHSDQERPAGRRILLENVELPGERDRRARPAVRPRAALWVSKGATANCGQPRRRGAAEPSTSMVPSTLSSVL